MEAVKNWHALGIESALQKLEASTSGLTSAEASERLARFGRNEIARRKPVSPARLLARQFANFFVLVLLFAAALAFAVSFVPGEGSRRLTGFFILGVWSEDHCSSALKGACPDNFPVRSGSLRLGGAG